MMPAAMRQELILDHYRRPRHHGLREPFDAEVRHSNPVCGDEVALRVRLAGPAVADVSYQALGCSISQASASVLADLVIGRTVTDAVATAQRFRDLVRPAGAHPEQPSDDDEEVLGDALAFAGVAMLPARVRCALLAWDAFVRASADAVAARPDQSPT